MSRGGCSRPESSWDFLSMPIPRFARDWHDVRKTSSREIGMSSSENGQDRTREPSKCGCHPVGSYALE
eukprot:gene23911-biopygen9714